MGRHSRDRAVDNRIAAELVARGDALKARMHSLTVPFYVLAPPKVPVLVGSGVLLTLASERFLLTAGHVLDWREEGQLVVGLSPEFVTIAGTLWRYPPLPVPEDDPIDLGIIHLRGGPWDNLPFERFCAWEELDVNPPIMEKHTFGVMGFPVSKNKKPAQGDRLSASALPVAGLECDEDEYVAAAKDPRTNVMIGYDEETMYGAQGMHTAPSLRGVSGGGVWRFGRRLRDATSPPLLSAIFTARHKGKHKYLLGTRVSVVLELLRGQFPHVREFIEAQREG
jgi:hypothetical protein